MWDFSGWSKEWSAFVTTSIVGFSWYHDGNVHGSGPTYRLALSVPETEFSIGPYLRYLSYDKNGGATRKFAGGLRVDSGFSSYFTFYLGLGKDYGPTTSGTLDRAWLWSAGVQFTFPASRIPWNR